MLKKNLFFGVTIALFFATTGASFAEFKFPSKIPYDIFVKGSKTGTSLFSCRVRWQSNLKMYQISFGNFPALGFISTDRIYSLILKDDLSLSRTLLMRGRKRVYELKVKKVEDPFSPFGEIHILMCKDKTSSQVKHTEILEPYKIIDLLSLFLVASKSVASGKKEPKKFNFLVNKSTEIVKLRIVAKENVFWQGRSVVTTLLELSHHNQEVLTLNIYHDIKNGFYFPIRLKIIDDVQGLVEFKAFKAF